jgi:phosphoesterase RecJ-like protein
LKKDFIVNNKIDTASLVKALDLIEKSRYILIITHVSPDADTISSGLALSNYFSENKINHKVFNAEAKKIPQNLDFINRFDKITDQLPKQFDLAICVDCGTKKRLGVKLPDGVPLINIDHHKSNDGFGDVNILEPFKASTAEVLYDFFKFNGLYITKPTAIALYVGIYDDSLAFTTPRCDEVTYEKINFLVKCGADPSYISQHLTQRDSLAKLRILPKVFNSLQLYKEGTVATIYCTKEWFEQTGALPHETEVALNMVLNMSIVKVAIYLRIQNERTRISLRSKEDIDVSQIAQKFGGGGHLNAAGCSIKTLNLDEAKEKILKEVFETTK